MDSIKTNFSELLAAISSEDSMTILFAFLMTLLIGWLMRYLWDRSKIGGLRDTLAKSEQEKIHFKGQWEKLQDKYALQEADLKKSNLELVNKSAALEAADGEKRTLNSRLNATLVDLDKSKEEFQETSGRLEDLNDQILGLRTKNAQLNATIEEKTNTSEIYSLTADTTAAKYEQEAADLASENILLKNSIEALKANLGTEGTAGATLRLSLSQLEAENENLKTEIATSLTDSTETAALQAQLATLTAENEALKVQIATPTSETTELQAELATLEAEKEKLADALAEVTQLEGGNEVLNMAINNLITENEQLKNQVEAIPQYEAGNEALNNSMQTLITENEGLQTNAEAVIQYEAGNEVLNATITELIEKNEALEAQLTSQVNNQVAWSVNDNSAITEETTEAIEEDMDVEISKAKLRAAIGGQIPKATAEERDDLKQINGVGPFIEEKLNDLGIYTFEQISQLDEELIETLTNAIEFFPGRIERDDWVGQADRLFYTKGSAPQEMNNVPTKMATSRYANATERIELSAAPTPTRKTTKKSRSLSKPDDLKKIEGIGPKISEILNTAGIYTFSNLSQTPVDRLKGILADAGNRYKLHNPQTWPQQAELAAIGAWDELKTLQDRLDGGRDVAKG